MGPNVLKVEVGRVLSARAARRLRSAAVGVLAGFVVTAVYSVYLWRTMDNGGLDSAAVLAPPPVAAPDFLLTDQRGEAFSTADVRGKVWVAELTHASCPDECGTVTANMARLRDRLAELGLLGRHVMLLSFSGHPLVDGPRVLAQLADRYDADPASWRFLTGAPDYLQDYIGAHFFLPVDVLPFERFGTDGPPPYAIVRTPRIVLVDRDGRVRNYFPGDRLHLDREMEFLLEEIRQLLLEG